MDFPIWRYTLYTDDPLRDTIPFFKRDSDFEYFLGCKESIGGEALKRRDTQDRIAQFIRFGFRALCACDELAYILRLLRGDMPLIEGVDAVERDVRIV